MPAGPGRRSGVQKKDGWVIVKEARGDPPKAGRGRAEGTRLKGEGVQLRGRPAPGGGGPQVAGLGPQESAGGERAPLPRGTRLEARRGRGSAPPRAAGGQALGPEGAAPRAPGITSEAASPAGRGLPGKAPC